MTTHTQTKIQCIIDQREQHLKQLIQKEPHCTNIHYEMLELGDVVFRTCENNDILIIERKTIPDLAASIKDGRYHKQKKALLDKYKNQSICYIIEGPFAFVPQQTSIQGITHDAIVSCILNTQLRDNIRVMTTKGIDETWEVVRHIHKRLEKQPDKYQSLLCMNDIQKEILFTGRGGGEDDKIQKEKVQNKNDCYIAQLCQIPGISKKTAIVIHSKYHTMKELLYAIDCDGAKAFTSLKTDTGRKLSSTVINNIILYMKD